MENKLKIFIENKFNQEIDNQSIFDLVCSLGNIFFSYIKLTPTTNSDLPFEFKNNNDIIEVFKNNEKYCFACQLMQVMFLKILKAFNIKCQPSCSYLNYSKSQTSCGHALIEYFDENNNSFTFDPCFNCHYKSNNKILNAKDVNNCLFNKINIEYFYVYAPLIKTKIYNKNKEILVNYYNFNINLYEKSFSNYENNEVINNNILKVNKETYFDWKDLYSKHHWYN